MKMPRLVLYPLLAAAYPVLALAAANPGEIPGWWVLIWPLGISLLVSLGAWVLLSVFIRDPDRRAFLTLMVVVVFAWYGYFTIGLTEIAWAAPYADTVLPFLFIVAYLAGATYLVFRLVPRSRPVATAYPGRPRRYTGSSRGACRCFRCLLPAWGGRRDRLRLDHASECVPHRVSSVLPGRSRSSPRQDLLVA